MHLRRAARVTLLFAAAACSSDGGEDDAADAAAPGDTAPWAEDATARLTIAQWTFDDGVSTGISGLFYDAAPHEPFDERRSAGGCRVRERRVTACDACNGVCVADGDCQPYPRARDAGPLTVRGSGDTVVIEPGFDGHYADVHAGARFDAGDGIAVTASGGELPAFAADLAMVAAIEVDAPPAPDAGPWAIAWTPGDPGSRVRVEVQSDLHGGGPPATITCDAPDAAGGVEIASELLDLGRFRVRNGCGECPVQTVTRYRRAEVVADGLAIDVVVSSVRSLFPAFGGG